MGSGDPLLLKGALVIGPRMVAEILWSIARVQRRSLAEDARRVIAKLRPQPKIHAAADVPSAGPFLLVSNHFQAQGLWIGWAAAGIAAAVAGARPNSPHELHWMIMAEWRRVILGVGFVNPISATLFPRAARMWGLIPVPVDPTDVGGRATALSRTLGYLGKRREGDATLAEPVAMFPEGEASVALREARPGSGAFISRVSSMGVPIVPVGIYEQGDVLLIRFGGPISVVPSPESAVAVDDWARTEVMVSIGRLLPSNLWGFYAGEIARREG